MKVEVKRKVREMKKIRRGLTLLLGAFVAASLLACAILVGCGGGNSGAQVDENAAPIVGTWVHESGGFTYEFKSDGTGAYTIEGDDPMPYTYEDDGKILKILYDGDTAASDHEYTVEGDTLNIQEIFGSHVYKRK
jgi:hypothetical protein